MYYPFFRGRKHELFAVERLSSAIAKSKVIPIIEPVGFTFVKRLKTYAVNNMPLILIVNPRKPKEGVTPREIHNKIIDAHLKDHSGLSIGILITSKTKSYERTRLSEIEGYLDKYKSSAYSVTLIHYNEFDDPKALLRLIRGYKNVIRHIFENDNTTASYQSVFDRDGKLKVLLKDSFAKKSNNADYPKTAYEFSDLHKTYSPAYDGFGDYTIVGDTIAEGGSYARTVAIHFTHPIKSNVMMRHFLSRTDDGRDDAGKFEEALNKLAAFLTANPFCGVGTAAAEFLNMNATGVIKTLGYSKELSMINHLEVYMKIVK